MAEVDGRTVDVRARERDPIRTVRSAGYAFDDAFGKSWADGVYRLVRRYSGELGFLIGALALRATAATRIYDHRRTRPEDSPTFKVAY